MQDEPAILEQVMTLFGKILIEALEVTADAVGKAEFYHVTLGDNITAPMVGRKLFQKWCMPYYNRASDTLLAKKIHFFVHMDGDLKPLWEDIDQCRHHGIDSLSPPPDNDTSVQEAFDRWPKKFVWTNFPSSVHLQQPEKIYAKATELLEQGGHSRCFWIQISEDIPPGAWKTSFPIILRAIKDFGKP